MKTKRRLIGGAFALGTAAAAWTVRTYYNQTGQLFARLLIGSQVLDTATGLIECTVRGEGPPVLLIHGGGGGYDQGVLISTIIGNDFKFVVPSRFGYLRTPLQADNSPVAQADAYAALLDTLEIPSAAIMGVSAGGPSALYFALRHPERCNGLVLLSSISQPLPDSIMRNLHRVRRIAKLIPDFSIWMMAKTMNLRMLRLLDRSLTINTPMDNKLLREIIYTTYPLHMRLAGAKNDFDQIKTLEAIPLAEVAIPTLVIHGTADSLVPYNQGRTAVEKIPGAKLLSIPGGSHYCLATHADQAVQPLKEFLFETAAEER